MKRQFVWLVIYAFTLCVSVAAQTARIEPAKAASSTRVLTYELDSRLMNRKMPYRVVTPVAYYEKENSGRRFPVVYLLHGLTGHFDNWTARTSVVDYSASMDVIIVTPEGEDGWYTDNLTKENEKYETYIIKELIPEIDKKFRTIDRRNHRAIAGLSMGGFGAIKFGLKYPDMFALAGSFSGALGAANITEKQFPGAIGKTINTIFGPFGGEVRKANDPFDIVRRATADKVKTFPFLYLDCGTEDFLFQSNREFVALLLEKNVPHEYRQLPGAHNWKYWDKQVEEFLRLSTRFLN
jgi:putative tributyrin esterase